MIAKYTLLILLLSYSILFSQDLLNLYIKVSSPNLSSTDTIYISGNNEKLGNWQPDKIKLHKQNNQWQIQLSFPKNTHLEFKFTKGSWETEALDENGTVPGNHILDMINDTTLNITIKDWNRRKNKIEYSGQVTGKVVHHKEMTFKGILPRNIVVWLPPGYDDNVDNNYPVLYMHDGQNLFDPSISFTGRDWSLDETADSLIRSKIIAPIIIVGIYNTNDRSEEYSPTKKGNSYMKFIVSKLKPFIDSTYRTLPDRENTAVGGSSMGGLISFMLAWNYSSIFSKAACFSPAFKYENFNYTSYIKEYQGIKKDVQFYIDNGGIGLEKELQPGVDSMIEILQEKNYTLDKDLFFVIDSTAEHNELAWAKRAHFPLKIFFSNFSKLKTSKYEVPEEANILDDRHRVQYLINAVNSRDGLRTFSYLTLNYNYRDSHIGLNKINNPISVSVSTESGINIMKEPFFILPYFKVGPEFRIHKFVYLDMHVGLSVFTSVFTPEDEFFIAPIPFYGSEFGVIYNLSKNYSFELEFGFNGFYPIYLYYLSLSFSFI